MSVVTVENNRYTVDPLYQYDRNQTLEIRGLSLPSVPEIHFANKVRETAIVRQAAMNERGIVTVGIPNELLAVAFDVLAYVCIYEGEAFRCLYKITIPVTAKKKPDDYITPPDDEKVYSYNALENKLENTLAVSLKRYDDVNAKYSEALELLSTTVAETEKIKDQVETIVADANLDSSALVYVATFYATSYANIREALDKGKIVVGKTAPDYIYRPLIFNGSDYVIFGGFNPYNGSAQYWRCTDSGWTSDSDTYVKTDIIDESEKIPTSQAVYNAFADKLNIGIFAVTPGVTTYNEILQAYVDKKLCILFDADVKVRYAFMLSRVYGESNSFYFLGHYDGGQILFEFTTDNLIYATKTSFADSASPVFIGSQETTFATFYEAAEAGKYCVVKYNNDGIMIYAQILTYNESMIYFTANMGSPIVITLDSDNNWTTGEQS